MEDVQVELPDKSQAFETGTNVYLGAALRPAYELVTNEAVALLSLDEKGRLVGEVSDGTIKGPWQTEVTLTPQGSVQSVSCACPDEATCHHGLAVALRLVHVLASKKRRCQAKPLLSRAPAWLSPSFQLDVRGKGAVVSPEIGIDLRTAEDLQAYWVLSDLVRAQFLEVWPTSRLVAHVFELYGQATWFIKRTAMEALMRRIKSATSEGLKTTTRPAGREVLGQYQVRRKGGSRRPYDVHLHSNNGFDASCSCPDFAKNTLRFCKHIATIYNEVFSSQQKQKRLAEASPRKRPRIAWHPPTGLISPEDPLSGLTFSAFDAEKGKGALHTFFRKSFGDVKRAAPPPDEQPKKRLEFIEGLQNSIKKSRRTLDVDASVLPLLAAQKHSCDWPARYQSYQADFRRGFKKLKVQLYPYQIEGVTSALKQGRFLLADDMGLGKTVQGIAWAEALLEAGLAKRIFVICPAPLKTQWRMEWYRVKSRKVKIVEGAPEERTRLYRGRAEVLVLNYELLLRDMQDIAQARPGAVILDEAQRIKNFATQTSQRVKQLGPPFRLILTGTPMENRVQELSSLMDWIEPAAMGPAWRLNAEMSFGDGGGHGKTGVRGLAAIRKRIAPHFLRRRREEVLSQLPERTDTNVPVAMTGEQREVHDGHAAEVAKLAARATKRPLSPEEHIRLMAHLTNMRIVSNGYAQYYYQDMWQGLRVEKSPERRLDGLFSPKLSSFRTLVEGLLAQPSIKVVIFSQWQRMLQLAHWSVSDLLAQSETEAVFFTGAESQKRRSQNIVNFHDDPGVRLFFATDAGGVGLNLQRAATVCINLELPWNPAVLAQRIGRIYRLGQKKPVQIFNLMTENGIEARIHSLVGQKKAVFDELFDGTSDEVIFDRQNGFYSQVREAITDMKIVPPGEPAESEPDQDLIPDAWPDTRENVDPHDGSAHIESDTDFESPKTFVTTGAKIAEMDLVQAFQGIRVSQQLDGGIQINAEKESAALLAGLFQGMGQLLANASQPAKSTKGH